MRRLCNVVLHLQHLKHMGKAYNANVWLLNFEHDLALASGKPFYMPPKVAVAMNEDMAPLPLWLTGGATVLTRTSTTETALSPTLRQEMSQLGITGELVPMEQYKPEGNEDYYVWGWDPQSVQQLSKFGYKPKQDLDFIKEWSHRGKTIDFLRRFADEGIFPADMLPRVAYKAEEIELWTQQQQLVMKAPLSGSGRGIWWAFNGYDFNVQRWSKRTLEIQGCILCEPIWQKTGDFAMEFNCQNGKATFAGYSQFLADGAGVYRCNLLRSDEAIAQTLANKIGATKIERIKQLWIDLLQETIATKYNGIVGIDMLTGSYNGEETINPCVEVNLRMTMGMAARMVYDKWIVPGKEGEFRTLHFKNDGELAKHAEAMRAQHKTIFENGKIRSGYFMLTATNQQAHYGIEIEVKD